MDYNLIQNNNYEEFKDKFWEVNPEFKFVAPYDAFYTSITDKKKTSMVMWAIYLLCDINSPKIRLRLDEREEEIKTFFIKDPEFTFTRYQELIDAYPKVVLSKIQRELKVWHDKIEERNKFLESVTYDMNTFEALDKMMKDSKPIWEAFGKVYKEYQEENIETRARGGREESFSEKLLNKK
jgi:hypothetical protein